MAKNKKAKKEEAVLEKIVNDNQEASVETSNQPLDKPEKISENQLARLQSTIKTVDQLTNEVGQIEVRKYNLLKAMETVQARIETLRKEFSEEYGTDNINIQDGTITYSDTTPNPGINPNPNIVTNGKTN